MNDQYNPLVRNYDAPNIPFLATELTAQRCPSDLNKKGDLVLNPHYVGRGDPRCSTSSYKGVAGTYPSAGPWLFWDYATYIFAMYPASMPGKYRGPLHAVVSSYPGVVPQGSTLGCEDFSSIKDGTSNTLFIGEYSTKTFPEYRAQWAVSWGFYSLGHVGPFDAVRVPDRQKCIDLGMPAYICNRALSSQHPGGMNFSKCDGSVTFVATTIDSLLYSGLGTVDGGEPVPSDL